MSRNRARDPAVSLDVGEGYLLRALALAAEGRATEARDEARRAQPVLATAVGEMHEWTQAAVQLASDAAARPAILRPNLCPAS
jgi:hypothetical protein